MFSNCMSRRDRTYHDIYGLIDDVYGDVFNIKNRSFKNNYDLRYRFETLDDKIVAWFDLPGVKPNDVEVSVSEHGLTISYTLRGKADSLDYNVNQTYDVANASAKLEHGVLELSIPKKVLPGKKKIDIEIR